jgi:predicted flap endonuclease-1-like 5' DNA nuclease/peptidoglycan hydrolase CwlO-like protein
MPELNVIHIAIIAAVTVIGAIVGWVLRGKRSEEEKAAVSAGWQEQISAQRIEHDRLTEQNKALMEQVSQYLASNKDAKNRAKELSEAIQEAYARRDQLQREIKDIRSTLEVAMNERDQLQSNMSSQASENVDAEAKDTRIKKLQIELENWQNRLPPLIEKFRQRNEDAEQLEAGLATARERIAELEASLEPGQTRIEPVRDPEELTDGRDASNDAIDDGEPDVVANDDEEEEAAAVEEDLDDDEEPDTGNDQDGEEDLDEDEDGEEDEDESNAPINGSRDNLKAIKGVGPAIEKTLNEMGIFRYRQIADMSEYDIDRIAKRLKGFRSRIYREDWIGQARDLRDQESSD